MDLYRIARFLCVSGLSAFLAIAPTDDGHGASGPVCAADDNEADDNGDPFEPWNRAMFSVNDTFDEYALEPAARAWDFVFPHVVQRSIGNVFDNLLFPVHFVNNCLQGEIDPAAISVTRFAVNTTVGLAGLFDPATGLGLPIQRADFGQTLGKWGVPSGPYLVWPVWGSSSVRDTAGLLVDAYFGIQTFFLDVPILIGSTAVNSLNTRSLNLETVQGVRDASFDLYIAARDAYQQQRLEAVEGVDAARAARDEDLYFFEEDDFEDVGVPLDEDEKDSKE